MKLLNQLSSRIINAFNAITDEKLRIQTLGDLDYLERDFLNQLDADDMPVTLKRLIEDIEEQLDDEDELCGAVRMVLINYGG